MHAALLALGKEVRGRYAAACLASLLRLSPLVPELTGVWSADVTVKNQKILAALMSTIAAVLRVPTSPPPGAASTEAKDSAAEICLRKKKQQFGKGGMRHADEAGLDRGRDIARLQRDLSAMVIKTRIKVLH